MMQLNKKKKKGSRKKPTTPRSQVKNAIRQVWLRSRERAAALKRDGYTCQDCFKKQSKAVGREFFVEVHHKKGIGNWERVIDIIFEEILCDPMYLESLCPDCHDKKKVGSVQKRTIDFGAINGRTD